MDFIFGNAAVVFEECVIKTVPRAEGAQKRARNVVAASGRIDPGQTTGFVFVNCTVDGNKEFVELFRTKPQSYRLYLGRPWKEYARTLYVSCYLGKVVRPEGWLPWRGDLLSRHSIMENLTVEALVQTTQQGLSGAARHQSSMSNTFQRRTSFRAINGLHTNYSVNCVLRSVTYWHLNNMM